ncbi:MAG TPA: acetylxylan esterase [Bryobacterales bacterium]|nr:acetylxylan esterase [Bryobacterales bacterium]
MTTANRISVLFCLALSATLAVDAQDDPRWAVVPNINDLDDWNVQPNSPALAKAMGDAAEYVLRWKAPGSAEDWRVRRPQVERGLRKSLGLETPPPRTPLNVRTVASDDRGDYIVDNLIFDSRRGFPVTANLYRPKTQTPGRLAAILSPIGHLIDDGKRDTEVQARSIKLARMGFIVLSYDAIGHGERMTSGNTHHEGGFALLPLGETITGWMVWDSMRGIDYLLSRPDVDPSRIGITGNSGGGLNALYTAAVDDRISAAVVVGYTFEFNNWIKYGGAHGTCSYLPGLFREMEWFEVAGLIAPRPLLMLNGERDPIFPVSGARRASNSTKALYSVLGHGDLARFYAVPKQGHAYSRPYREQMYGWMAKHLLHDGDGGPIDEGPVETLAEDDPRLLCDPDERLMLAAPSVVDLARREGITASDDLSTAPTAASRHALREFIKDLTAPPDPEPHNLMPIQVERSQREGEPEKVYFLSEIGQHIPGLLWVPPAGTPTARTIIVVDEEGKGAVAESDLVEPLRRAGNAVLTIDLRGRGETLGHMGNRTNNYHLISISVMAGRPLAGRRGFDLTRAVDFVERRDDLPLDKLTVLGRGDDSLPALLAAVADPRIERIVADQFVSSFVSQMIPAHLPTRQLLHREWNQSLMRRGKVSGVDYTIDLASVIPSILRYGDVPEIVSLLAERKVLFTSTKDGKTQNGGPFWRRLERLTSSQDLTVTQEPLSADYLQEWLTSEAAR